MAALLGGAECWGGQAGLGISFWGFLLYCVIVVFFSLSLGIEHETTFQDAEVCAVLHASPGVQGACLASCTQDCGPNKL